MKVAEEKADSNQTTLETIVAETLIETAVLASLLTNMLTTMFVPALLAKMVVSATELDDPTLGADTIVLENNSCIASIIFGKKLNLINFEQYCIFLFCSCCH